MTHLQKARRATFVINLETRKDDIMNIAAFTLAISVYLIYTPLDQE